MIVNILWPFVPVAFAVVSPLPALPWEKKVFFWANIKTALCKARSNTVELYPSVYCNGSMR